MAKFSTLSKQRLETCHPDLQTLFNEVIQYIDCTILCGHRNKEDQNKAFEEGKSQKKWPDGNHNKLPSLAVDVIPYPIDWNDHAGIKYFAGFVMGVAKLLKAEGKMKCDIRWGGDWDRDHDLKDNKFNDLVHFEVVK
jgi:peptidoglycan L-alanyl-D-glutamate endopeptidase CwlK